MQKRINMIVCGHIDHGKSTFVGKLMSELGLIPEDRIQFLKNNSNTERLEYSHLVDSLADEKEKGITISLSQMAFKYKNQEYAFLDAPGHFEFMQNMITGAAKADMAFLIIDALEGIKESTLRHLYSLSFIGVQNITVLVNKMDLVSYSEKIFLNLKNELKNKFNDLNLPSAEYIPISAYNGENLVQLSRNMSWYTGPTIAIKIEELKSKSQSEKNESSLRFVVHDVYPSEQENMIVGELLSGQLSENQSIYVNSLQSPTVTFVRLQPKSSAFQLPIYNGEKYKTIFVDRDVSTINRGSILFNQTGKAPFFVNQFICSLFNFGQQNINSGDTVQIKIAKQSATAVIKSIDRIFNCADLKNVDNHDTLPKGYVALCLIETQAPICCELFHDNRGLGRLVVIKNHTISAAGKITKLMT